VSRSKHILDRLVTWSPVLLLGGLAALTYWLDAQIQPPPARIDGSSRHDPDLFIEDFRAVSFDVQGRPRQALAARRAQHFPDDESIALTALSLTVTDPDEPAMSVIADQGIVTGNRETLLLEGNVKATREASPAAASGGRAPTGASTITTEFLRVVPKKGFADTDRPVTIEDSRGIIHSVGLQVDNQAKTVKLKSAVHGTITPAPIPK
jgi:lipopolysaccharide export system protein LptC